MTALVAFTVAFIIAAFIMWANVFAIVLLVALAVFALYKTNRIHKNREEVNKLIEEETNTADKVLNKCVSGISNLLSDINSILLNTTNGLINEDRKLLKKQCHISKEMNHRVKKEKDNIHKTILKLQQDSIETGHFYVQVLDYQRELAHSVHYVLEPVFKYVDNKHKPIIKEQAKELNGLVKNINVFFEDIQLLVKEANYSDLEKVHEFQEQLLSEIKKVRKAQIKRIKNKDVGTKNSMLYMNILMELRNITLYGVNMLKAQRDFHQYTNEQ